MTATQTGDVTVREGVVIRKSAGGWSGTWNSRTTRPYAVLVDGRPLRTADGSIRTFGSRDAARKAAEVVA